jgi:hypothetical protein
MWLSGAVIALVSLLSALFPLLTLVGVYRGNLRKRLIGTIER